MTHDLPIARTAADGLVVLCGREAIGRGPTALATERLARGWAPPVSTASAQRPGASGQRS